MPAAEMALLLDRTAQQHIAGRGFLKLFHPTLSSSMLGLLTPMLDFILRKQSLQSHRAVFQLASCKLAQSAPSQGPCWIVPQCHTHGLYFSLSSSNGFTVLIFQRPQTSWRASISVLGDHFLKLSLGFIKALQFEAQLKTKFRHLPFIPLSGPKAFKVVGEITLKIWSRSAEKGRLDHKTSLNYENTNFLCIGKFQNQEVRVVFRHNNSY